LKWKVQRNTEKIGNEEGDLRKQTAGSYSACIPDTGILVPPEVEMSSLDPSL